MLRKKNLSPRQLSAYTATILSVPISIGIYFLNNNWIEALISLVLILSGSYALILYIFQRFIYRKLKLIYKFIYQTKASKREETYYKYVLPEKSIDDVRQDVEQWAKQRSTEIDLLKRNEVFRKEFLQNLSHEFKTPIFAIQGYIDILSQGAVEDPVLTKKYLDRALQNVERLTNLLQDLDEISKLERGEVNLQKQYFVIQDVVHKIFDALCLTAEKNNISFSIKKGCETPFNVYADKDKIEQVLTNLVDNAIKYGRSGGSVIASFYNTDEKNVLIEISDDGMGIPEEHLQRIFERFYRTVEGRNRDATGTGLGLAICKHIVEAHGHAIHVRSTEGVGTTIGFTLNAK